MLNSLKTRRVFSTKASGKLVPGTFTARDLKNLVYESRYRARSSSHTLYTGSRKKPKSGPKGEEQHRQPEQ
jgi:hypothetical protein